MIHKMSPARIRLLCRRAVGEILVGMMEGWGERQKKKNTKNMFWCRFVNKKKVFIIASFRALRCRKKGWKSRWISLSKADDEFSRWPYLRMFWHIVQCILCLPSELDLNFPPTKNFHFPSFIHQKYSGMFIKDVT